MQFWTKWWEAELATVVIVVAIMVAVVIAPRAAAAPANFFELAAPLLSLSAVLAVLADRLFQILFGLMDIAAALVVAVGASGSGYSSQERHA